MNPHATTPSANSAEFPAAATQPKAIHTGWRFGFWSLIVTQFQSAFNDNALKFLVIYLIVDMHLSDSERDWLVLVVGGLFALPFILFSMSGGYLADRFSKRSVTIGTKYGEVGAMMFVLLALARGNLVLECAGVFLLSSLGAVFGPSKYGLLPEILPEERLSWGNGVIELGTFLAAISATVAGGSLAEYFRGRQIWSGVALFACTMFGLATSFGITRLAAANPEQRFNANPLGDLFKQLRMIREDRVLEWAVVGNTYLWFLAALLQFTIVIYGHDILRIDDRHSTYLQAAVMLGIGVGSLLTGYFSDGKIEYGLIPIGAVGMTIFGFLSAGHELTLLRAGIYLAMVGFFGGFYAVPLNALIQHRPDPDKKGLIIAAANLLSWAGVFLAAGAYFALAQFLHLGADRIFFAGACMTLLATLYAVAMLRDSTLRTGLWLLTHTFYRLRVEGRENIPERGPAIFVTDSISTVEAMMLAAATDRAIRFVVTAGDTHNDGSADTQSRLAQALRITPISPMERGGAHPASITETLSERAVVCLVGEADALLDSRRWNANPGLAQLPLAEMVAQLRAPVVPVSVGDTSRGILRATPEGGVALQKPASLRCRIAVRFGPPQLPRPLQT